MTSKIKRIFANKVGEKFLDDLLKNNKLIIKEIKGMENLSNLKTGAILTCNHFNPFDCFTIEKTFRLSGQAKTKRLEDVIWKVSSVILVSILQPLTAPLLLLNLNISVPLDLQLS